MLGWNALRGTCHAMRHGSLGMCPPYHLGGPSSLSEALAGAAAAAVPPTAAPRGSRGVYGESLDRSEANKADSFYNTTGGPQAAAVQNA
jgi:hypothetical protein